ncbi:hypothetical protein FHS68_001844 [Dyadobacter arcticus]|uniref:Uncharacterized protein n=1 Tax=Dyadobacter arcticus TaxID=1078754 RepID=A0ABX0UKZ9_9BACT|nr:hypothetical protein [Dyadobacter arcticus]
MKGLNVLTDGGKPSCRSICFMHDIYFLLHAFQMHTKTFIQKETCSLSKFYVLNESFLAMLNTIILIGTPIKKD